MAVAVGIAATESATAQQTGRAADSAKAWHDSIPVTRPRFARATAGERLALSAFTALALPVGLTAGALTIMPPTLNALYEHDDTHIGIALGTGWGFGGDSLRFLYFPDVRVQLDIGYYWGRERPIIVHAAVLSDLLLASVHDRDFVWLGLSGGAGVASDAHTYTPYVEGWFGAINPLGIGYVPFVPMHNLGVRARFGYEVTASRTWYELSLGLTSTFAF